MSAPSWMVGCLGRPAGIGPFAGLRPSLTGWHRYGRVSLQKKDQGRTVCEVCGQPPRNKDANAAWEFLLEAEAEQSRIRDQARWLRLARKGFVE